MLRSLIIAGLLVIGLSSCSDDTAFEVSEAAQSTSDYQYVIPPGAGEALDAGAPLEILPAELNVRVGEIIEIVNEDDRGHSIGPFFVGANETLRQRFVSVGEFNGICTVHPSGQLVVRVTE